MSRARVLAASAAIGTLIVLASARPAHAYPQFQLSTGTARCGACHVSPSGGGLITSWGREESADTISQWGGDGRFLHGAWTPPKWLELGADYRGAALVNDVGGPEGAEFASFPMQADLYARTVVGAWSANLIGGVRGAARPANPSMLSRIVSREHYLMWKPKGSGPYVRAGRFFAPAGLRLVEHVLYNRRYASQGVLEETYNLSGGWTNDKDELHLTLFMPDFLRPVGHRGRGAAAYYERRVGNGTAVGATARSAFGPEDDRHQLGVVGKRWFDGIDVLMLGELDVIHQSFDDVDASRRQLLAHLGATWIARQGLMTTIFYERFDEDVSIENVSRDGVGLQVQWFPKAHFEVHGFMRWQQLGGLEGDPAHLAMLMLHYWM